LLTKANSAVSHWAKGDNTPDCKANTITAANTLNASAIQK
jgi:hypothetical protein